MTSPEADAVCQAAFDGCLDVLRGLWQANSWDAATHAGYVQVDGTVAGLWTMGVQGFNTFELRSLAAEPLLQPATPLQYAAFAGKAEIVQFLLQDCGASKDEEGSLGASPAEIVRCHRVGLDGAAVEDDGGALELLDEEDAPLSMENLAMSLTQAKLRTSLQMQQEPVHS
eukprot:CAMPEP_0172709770 /NCGR_PEP_ID=MMETSP1074-20121228/55265_1 /TAXON_ID=2916 /ORGANISM="Ceratium fusus, Strain PA161109" /LENGTH=169 /DNA_ID=CAMNT_0013533077 /DNA_START=48 /DNA_END=557 /DNA_ORIENTATION=-